MVKLEREKVGCRNAKVAHVAELSIDGKHFAINLSGNCIKKAFKLFKVGELLHGKIFSGDLFKISLRGNAR